MDIARQLNLQNKPQSVYRLIQAYRNIKESGFLSENRAIIEMREELAEIRRQLRRVLDRLPKTPPSNGPRPLPEQTPETAPQPGASSLPVEPQP